MIWNGVIESRAFVKGTTGGNFHLASVCWCNKDLDDFCQHFSFMMMTIMIISLFEPPSSASKETKTLFVSVQAVLLFLLIDFRREGVVETTAKWHIEVQSTGKRWSIWLESRRHNRNLLTLIRPLEPLSLSSSFPTLKVFSTVIPSTQS